MSDATAAPSRRLRPALTAAAVLAVVVAAAWVLQSATSGGAGETDGSPAPPAYSIKVKRGGEVLKVYDLAALQALPQHAVVIDGKEQGGPLLATVLADAGAAQYDKVVVRGAGLRDRGQLELTAAQVRHAVQIDFSDRGTAKVCGPGLPWAAWVRDVLTISVD